MSVLAPWSATMVSLPAGSVELGTIGTLTVYDMPLGGGYAIFATDGSTTQQLASSSLTPSLVTTTSGLSYLLASSGSTAAVFATDGTPGGTVLLAAAGTSVAYLQSSLARDLFVFRGSHQQLYVTGGTPASTNQVVAAPLGDTFQISSDPNKTTVTVMAGNSRVQRIWIDGDTGLASPAGDEYAWVGGAAASWNVAGNWKDLTTGAQPALSPPGVHDSVVFAAGAAALAIPTGTVAYATASGSTTIAGSLSAGGIAETAGVINVQAGGSLTATTAGLTGGVAIEGAFNVGTADLAGVGNDIIVSGTAATASIGALVISGHNNGIHANDGARIAIDSLTLGSTDPTAALGAGIVIDANSVVEIGNAGDGEAGAVTVDEGNTLTIGGGFNVVLANVVNNGSVTLQGEVIGGATLAPILSLGTLSGTGSIAIASLGYLRLLGDLLGQQAISVGGGGTLAVVGNVLGSDTISLDSATLMVGGATPATIAAGSTVALAGTGNALVFNSAPGTTSGAITGFGATDAIYLPGSVTAATDTGNGLILLDGTHQVGSLDLVGSVGGDTFIVVPNAGNTSEIVRHPASPLAASAGGTGDLYAWVGPTGGDWNLAANWSDVSQGGTVASVAPGAADSVSFTSGTNTEIVLGNGRALAATFAGAIALGDGLTAGTLTQGAGSLLVTNGATVAANTATIDGELAVDGQASLASLALDGTLAATGAGAIEAGSLTLGGSGGSIATDQTGTVELGTNGGAQAGALTIDAGHTLAATSGASTIATNILNNGAIQIGTAASLSIGNLAGSGSLAAAAGARLTITGSVSGSQLIALDAGTLTIGGAGAQAVSLSAASTIALSGTGDVITFEAAPGAVANAAVSGFGTGDTLYVAGTVTSASMGATGLALLDGTSPLGTIALAGDYSGDSFLTLPMVGTLTPIVAYAARVTEAGNTITLAPAPGSVALDPVFADANLIPGGTLGTLDLQGPGSLTMAGSYAIADTLIEAGANLSGHGTLSGYVIDDGLLAPNAGGLAIGGSVTGTGTLDLAAGATLRLGGALASGISIAFAPAGTETLILSTAGSSLANSLTGITAGDRLDFGAGMRPVSVSMQSATSALVGFVSSSGVQSSYAMDNIEFAAGAAAFSLGTDSVTGDTSLIATGPAITAISSAAPSTAIKAGSVVRFTLTPNAPLTVSLSGAAPTLTLSNGANALYAGQDGNGSLTFTYTVASGDDTPDLKVTGLNTGGASITDSIGDLVNASGLASLQGSDTHITVDTVAPTPTGLGSSAPGTELAAGELVAITLNATAPLLVTGGVPSLSLSNNATAVYGGRDGAGDLVFNYTVASGDDTADLTIGTLALNGASITDLAGNVLDPSDFATIPGHDTHLAIDTVEPVVTTLTAAAPSDDLYAGLSVDFVLTPSAALTVSRVSGSPSLSLGNGATATFSGTDPSGDLLFTYTVAAGADTADLTVTGLSPGGAVITDAQGNTLNAVGVAALAGSDTHIAIDTASPYVSTVTSTASATTLGLAGVVNFALAPSAAVTVSTAGGTPALSLGNGALAAYTGTDANGNLDFAYTVATGDDTPDLTVASLVLNGAGIADANGDALNTSLLASLSGSDTHLVIDTTAPDVTTLTSSATGTEVGLGQSIHFTLTATAPLTASTTGGTPSLLLSNNGSATYTGASGSGDLLFTYVVAAGQDTADLTVTGLALDGGAISDSGGHALDAGGLATLAGSDTHLAIDTVAPTITTLAASASGSVAVTGAVINFTLTPSAALTITTSVGSPTLALGNGANASYAGRDSGGDLLFTYTVAGGQDTADLTVAGLSLNGASITDSAGNTLATANIGRLAGSNTEIAINTTGITTIPSGGTFTTHAGAHDIQVSGTLPTTIKGGGGDDTIGAGDGNIFVSAAAGDASIALGGGQDTVATPTLGGGAYHVTVGGGSDVIAMGSGAISLQAGNGNNAVYLPGTNSGPHALIFGNGQDTVVAGAGSLSVTNGSGVADIYLGSGASTLAVSTSGRTSVIGASGDATVSPIAGFTTIFAGGTGKIDVSGGGAKSHLTFVGFNTPSTVDGGAGNGLIWSGDAAGNFRAGTAGNSTVIGAVAGCTIQGGGNGDLLWASTSGQTVSAGGGNETLFGSGGETFNLGSGTTILVSQGASSTINAGSGVGYVFLSAGGQELSLGGGAPIGDIQVIGFDASADKIALGGLESAAQAVASETGSTLASGAYTQLHLQGGATVTFWGVASVGSGVFV